MLSMSAKNTQEDEGVVATFADEVACAVASYATYANSYAMYTYALTSYATYAKHVRMDPRSTSYATYATLIRYVC